MDGHERVSGYSFHDHTVRGDQIKPFKEDRMLTLSRKTGEEILIGNKISVRVVSCGGSRVRLAFDVPDDVRVLRKEVLGLSKSESASPDPRQRSCETIRS